MTKKIYSAVACGYLALALFVATPLSGQTNPEKNQTEKTVAEKNTTEKRPTGTYRVDFRIAELEGEKKLNSRSYSVILTGFVKGQLHAGTRVPVQSGEAANKQFQYFDVGQRIECQVLGETEHTINLRQFLELSNFALSEQASGGTYLPPMVRQFSSETTSTLELGKPTVISTLDDPSSKHTFQIEITAARLKD